MNLSASEIGQGIVEYAFLIVFFILVVIGILQLFGISVLDMFEYAVTHLGEAFV
jgi:Flp pilus assembly pilin Flp